MDPKKGELVRIMFKNGMNVKGVVLLWSNDRVVLKSENGSGSLLIFRPMEEILFVQIMNKPENTNTKVTKIEEVQNDSNDDLKLKKLVDLRKMLVAQEKVEIAEKLRNHNISEVKSVQYESPFIGNKK